MFVTREYDYALRILRVLSQNEQMTVKRICDQEHIPQPYSYKILKKLENASMVKAYRGTRGGYVLVARPEDVSLYDVYAALEGEIYLNECLEEGYICPNNQGGKHCTIHQELCALQQHIRSELKRRTMADMLRENENAG